MTGWTLVAILLGWPVVALALALGFGRAIDTDSPDIGTDDDLMDLVQPENLSDAEVDRRIARLEEAWL